MVTQATVDKTIKSLTEMKYEKVVENGRSPLKSFLKELEKNSEVDGWAVDPSADEDFIFSLIKGKQERLFRFKRDNTIDVLN